FECVSLHLRHAINCIVEPFSQQDVAVTRFVIGGAVLEPFFNQRVGQESVTQLGGFKRGLISLSGGPKLKSLFGRHVGHAPLIPRALASPPRTQTPDRYCTRR